MITNKTKCKTCNGTGRVIDTIIPGRVDELKLCPVCEGLGVPLRTIVEDQFDESAEIEGTLLHNDDVGYIDFEEEDYEF